MLSIKCARLVKGLTVGELAKKAGLGTSTVSQIESGAKSPSLATFMKIAEAMGFRASQLFWLEEQYRSMKKENYTDEEIRRKLLICAIKLEESQDSQNQN